jgi:hypothetical protein
MHRLSLLCTIVGTTRMVPKPVSPVKQEMPISQVTGGSVPPPEATSTRKSEEIQISAPTLALRATP